MSLSEQLQRVDGGQIAALKALIQKYGGTVPEGTKIDGYANIINGLGIYSQQEMLSDETVSLLVDPNIDSRERVGITSENAQLFAYGNGKYVTCGSSYIYYSDDGFSWSRVSFPISNPYRLVFLNNMFFLVFGYQTGHIAYSADGVSWSEASLPISSNQYMRDIAFSGGKFVAPIFNSNQYCYSTDGITWSLKNLPASSNWYTVAGANGKFVIFPMSSNKSKYAYSENGEDWSLYDIPITFTGCFAFWGNGVFWLYGNQKIGALSQDGVLWESSEIPLSGDVCFGAGKFFVSADTLFVYSQDGKKWRIGIYYEMGNGAYGVGPGNGEIIANSANNIAKITFPDLSQTDGLPSTPDAMFQSIIYKLEELIGSVFSAIS